MADMKFAFKVDGGKVLAKMHLAAVEQYAGKGHMFFNTGIIGDADIKPKDVTAKTKITFDFKNKGGVYELGVILKEPLDFKPKYTPDDIEKAKKEMNEDAEESVDSESGITDDAEDVDDKKKEAKSDVADEIQKLKEENHSEFLKAVEKARKTAIVILQNYMKVFGGEDQAKKITENDMQRVYFLQKQVKPYKMKYDNWRIRGIDEKQQKQLSEIIQTGDLDKFKDYTQCFVIAYSLGVKIEK